MINNLPQNTIQRSLEHLETNLLNPLGHVPAISTVTGTLRGIIGVAQVAFSVLATVFTLGFIHLAPEVSDAGYYVRHHFAHGAMNVARALIEIIPFVNLIMLAYDADTRWQEPNAHPSRYSYVPYTPPVRISVPSQYQPVEEGTNYN